MCNSSFFLVEEGVGLLSHDEWEVVGFVALSCWIKVMKVKSMRGKRIERQKRKVSISVGFPINIRKKSRIKQE